MSVAVSATMDDGRRHSGDHHHAEHDGEDQQDDDGEADAPAASLQASEVWMLPPYLPFPFPFSILQSNRCFNDLG